MDFVISKYFEGNTFFHRQDARLKIFFTFLFIFLLFIANHLITISFFLIISIISFLLTTKSFYSLIRLFSLPIFLFFFILVFNFLTIKEYSYFEEINAGEHIKKLNENKAFYWNRETKSWEEIKNVFYDFQTGTWTNNNVLWYKIGSLRITPFAFIRAFSAVIRIICMILFTKVLTLSTKPVFFTKAIEDLLYPLTLLRVPVSIFAMVISITYRFIPTLLDEASRIMKAQTSRGVDFRSKKLTEKTKALTSLIIPLFVSSFNKAWELAESMEARFYDPYKKRTRYRQLKFKTSDWISLIFVFLFTTFVCLIQWYIVGIPYWFAISYQRY